MRHVDEAKYKQMKINNTAKNAFQILLDQQKSYNAQHQQPPTKKKKLSSPSKTAQQNTSQSRFIPCPICNRHILNEIINSHIDTCLINSEKKGNGSDIVLNDNNDDIGTQQKSYETSSKRALMQEGKNTVGINMNVGNTTNNDIADDNNALSYLMHNVYQQKINSKPIIQRFHLHDEKGNVSWYSSSDNFDDNSVDIVWYSTVLLKCNNLKDATTSSIGCNENRDLELIISSSVPSSKQVPKYIQTVSRLSVPVLKSILQKSIRRCKPIQSIKVSLELTHKSLNDLLRRLPIIILEDSVLHPQFPFIVWLMVAVSKNFIPSKNIMNQIIHIIYQVSACPIRDSIITPDYNDSIANTTNDNTGEKVNLHLTSSYFNSECQKIRDTSNKESSLLFLRTMLLRRYYGGMACDIVMINNYIGQWMHRFQNPNNVLSFSIDVTDECLNDTVKNKERITWISMPFILHENAIAESKQSPFVQEIIDNGLLALTPNDMCYAGVDFHCSSILEDALSMNPTVFHALVDILQSNQTTTLSNTRDTCLKVLKTCMWKYRSGVNHKKFLVNVTDTNENVNKSLSHDGINFKIWELILPIVDEYAMKYLKSRLVRF